MTYPRVLRIQLSFKVAVIGAGLTGITAGILLKAKVPQIDLTIIEKNADVVWKMSPDHCSMC